MLRSAREGSRRIRFYGALLSLALSEAEGMTITVAFPVKPGRAKGIHSNPRPAALVTPNRHPRPDRRILNVGGNYSAVIARSAVCDEAIPAAMSEQGYPGRRLLRKKRSQ